MNTSIKQKQMPLFDSLKALHGARRDEIVITAMGTAREWMKLDPHPLDWVFVPSSMGQATSLGLGLALARPDVNVIVCNGDGGMLMNLGSLVSITAQAPTNLTILLFDNGIYEVTGAQPTPASEMSRHDRSSVDFVMMARAAGFSSLFEFDELESWRAAIREVIDAPGPTFAHLSVAPVPEARGPKSPGPGKPRAKHFAEALKAVPITATGTGSV
ncbi:MAG: thiamine pyrophosphate-dependent enzyme [Planctomycetaceae bacterium]